MNRSLFSLHVDTSQTTSQPTAFGGVGNPTYDEQILPTFRTFTFAELKVATKNFREDKVLGEGSFGKVFKGFLEEGPVAIKKLKYETQGFQEWQVSKLTFKTVVFKNLSVFSRNNMV